MSDRLRIVREVASLDESADGLLGVVGKSVDEGNEERMALRILLAMLDGVRRGEEVKVAELDDTLDDEGSVESDGEGRASLGIVLDERLGDEEQVVEEEEVAILDRVGVDDLEDGRVQQKLARRVVEGGGALVAGGSEEGIESSEDLVGREVLWGHRVMARLNGEERLKARVGVIPPHLGRRRVVAAHRLGRSGRFDDGRLSRSSSAERRLDRRVRILPLHFARSNRLALVHRSGEPSPLARLGARGALEGL